MTYPIDVTASPYNADPTGATDSATAFASAYSAVSSSGGIVYMPPGTYKLSSFPTMSANAVHFVGAGKSATVLNPTSNNNFINMTGQVCSIENCSIIPSGRISSGYWAIAIGSGSFRSAVRNVFIQYFPAGIYITSATGTIIDDVDVRYTLYNGAIYYSGTATVGSYGCSLRRLVCDNPYPVALTTYKTWATSTAFTVGQFTLVNSNIYQCTTAGTSASSGSGPSGFPSGTTASSIFTGTITDGTVQWNFVAPEQAWIVNDNYGYSLRMDDVELIDGYQGFATYDGSNTGSSYPKFGIINDLECDHNMSAGIWLPVGTDFQIINSWFGSSLQSSGLGVGSGYKGTLGILNSRIMGNAQHGMWVDGGVDMLIQNCWFNANGVSNPGNYDGIYIVGGVSNFNISNNKFGYDPDTGSAITQNTGVYVAAGASDYCIITNNIGAGQQTSSTVSDNGTGTHKTVTNNW